MKCCGGFPFPNWCFKNRQGSPLPRSGSTRRQGNLVLPRVYSHPHSTPWEKSFAFNLRVLESSLSYEASQLSYLNIALPIVSHHSSHEAQSQARLIPQLSIDMTCSCPYGLTLGFLSRIFQESGFILNTLIQGWSLK